MIPEAVFSSTVLAFFEPVRRYLDDPSVTEVMINGPGKIYVERRGKLERVGEQFPNVKALYAALRNTAQYVGEHVDEERPLLEGRLPDGSRLAAILPPSASGGPYVAIRRPCPDNLTLNRLVELESLTPGAAELIHALVECRQNVVISGGASSGKTALLNAISSLIPADERVVVIEHTKELQLTHEHVVTLEGRPSKKGVALRDLFRVTLRMRPDRLIVGELSGSEAFDVVQAMTSGACLTTLLANHPRDVLTRLETMSVMADAEMPLVAMRAQIASAIDVVIQMARYRDGTRKVSHISEVSGFDMDRNKYVVHDLYARQVHGVDRAGKVVSELLPTGRLPSCVEQIRAAGIDVPAVMHDAAWRRESAS